MRLSPISHVRLPCVFFESSPCFLLTSFACWSCIPALLASSKTHLTSPLPSFTQPLFAPGQVVLVGANLNSAQNIPVHYSNNRRLPELSISSPTVNAHS